jgi:hypothetical protein
MELHPARSASGDCIPKSEDCAARFVPAGCASASFSSAFLIEATKNRPATKLTGRFPVCRASPEYRLAGLAG